MLIYYTREEKSKTQFNTIFLLSTVILVTESKYTLLFHFTAGVESGCEASASASCCPTEHRPRDVLMHTANAHGLYIW